MPSSEEYLASFGVDLSSVDSAVNSTVTLLGHLGAAFPQVAKEAEKAERALLGTAKAAKAGASATEANTASQVRAASATRKNTDSIISQRYALYDVATTYGAVSAAILAADAYAIKIGADFESSFTNVERTSNASVESLAGVRQELTQLSTEIPLTFDEISKIATLGNQLGIDSSGLVDFTKNVAEFSAVTGIAVEQVALDFGTLGNLLQLGSGEYKNLGSSIALAGRNAAATEAQITAVAGQIASYTQLAGFSAAETIGLATALASLKVPPEQARSAIQELFTTLNEATAEGGQKLQNFAGLLGLSAEETRALVKTDPSGFVEKFAASLGKLDSEQLTLTLDTLGLSEKRVATVLTKLSSNTDELTRDLGFANDGFSEGTELARQYAIIADDLNTKFQELVNGVNAFVATFSGGAVTGLAGFLGILVDIVAKAQELANNPAVQEFGKLALIISTVIGLYVALRAANALALASAYALAVANGAIGGSGVIGGFRALISAVLGYTTVVDGATVSTLTLGTALKALLRATVILGLVATAIEGFTNFNGLAEELDNVTKGAISAKGGFEFLGDYLVTLNGRTQGVSKGMLVIGDNAYSAAQIAVGAFLPVIFLIQNMLGLFQQARAGASNTAAALGGKYGGGSRNRAGNAAVMHDDAAAADDLTDSYEDLGNAAGGAAEQVRTLVDYAGDLAEVSGRAFDIRFGSGQALDQITSQWSAIRQAIADTNQQIAEYQAKMQSLSADKAVREYWLAVANNYGDALRAGVLRGEIAEIDADLAKTAADLTKAQQKNSKTLVGNSDAAIENRAEILGLVKSYQEYVTSLASSGLSQADLAAKTAQLKAQFISQAQALGYPVSQLGVYSAAFDDLSTAIALVPRNVTVTGNVNPALQAIAELQSKLKGLAGQTYAGPTITNPTNAKEIRRLALESTIATQAAYLNQLRSSGNIAGAIRYADYLDANRVKLASGSYRDGGWTGNGNPWDVAGVVHGQEFVLNQRGAQMFPRSVLEAANKGQAPRFATAAPAAASNSGTGVMDLGSQTMRQLIEAIGSIYFGLTDADVGQAADRYHERKRASGG